MFCQIGKCSDMDRVNETFSFEAMHENIRQPHYGRFLRLKNDNLVELTWVTGPRGADTIVTIQFAPTGTGSYLRLTNTGFPDEEVRDNRFEA